MAAQAQAVPATLPVPPLRPDPEIMGNAEGNKKDLAKDRESALRYLETLERDAG